MIRDRWFWCSFFLGGFVLSLTLWFDFSMDQSICQYIAWVWKEYHLPPYVGAWDHTYLGILLVHRVAEELFGESIAGFRAFDFLVQLSCLPLVYAFGKKLAGSALSGFLAAIFFSVHYYSLGPRQVGVRETFIFWLLMLALAAGLALESRPRLRAALAGLALGMIFQLKPFYDLCWPVFGAWFWIDGFRDRPRKVWFELLIFSLACLVPSLLVLCYYWRLGLLLELYRATIWYNFAVYSAWAPGQLSKWMLFKSLAAGIFHKSPFILVSGVLAMAVLSRVHAPQAKKLYWALIVLTWVCLAAFLIQGKFIDYQLVAWWEFLAVFAGAGYGYLGSRLAGLTRGARADLIKLAAGLAAIGLLIKINVSEDYLKFSYRFAYRGFTSAYLGSNGTHLDAHQAANSHLAVQFLAPRLQPGDQVEVLSPYPLIPLLLKKKLPSRFCNVHHLLFLPRQGQPPPLLRQWISEYQSDVIKANPRYFVICDLFGRSPFFNSTAIDLKDGLRTTFPELNAFFTSNYRFVTQFGKVEIYERVSP